MRERQSYYLNTDLDLISKRNLSGLLSELESKCCILHGEKHDDSWFIRAESLSGEEEGGSDPSQDIGSLLDVLENLDEKSSMLLRSCETIEFNIGWQAGDERPAANSFTLEPELLARIAALGGRLATTIYPASEYD